MRHEAASSQTIINQTTCVPTGGASPQNCLDANNAKQTITVDCNTGGSISNALASLTDRNGPNRIVISGTCAQGLTVAGFNRLTFAGPATITRGWSIINSANIALNNLTFDFATAPAGQNLSSNSSIVMLSSTTITRSSNFDGALVMGAGSSVGGVGSSVTGNLSGGVLVGSGSTFAVANTTITDNGGNGILVRDGGGLRLFTRFGGQDQPSHISGNANEGIELEGGTIDMVDGGGTAFIEIHDNGATGLDIGVGFANLEGNIKIYNNEPGDSGPAQAFVAAGTLVFGQGSQITGLITAFRGNVILGSGGPMTHTGGVQLLAGSVGAVVEGSTADQMTCDATSWATTLFGAGTITTNNCPLDAPTGTVGPIGPQGLPGVSGHQVVSNAVPQVLGKDAETTVGSTCPAGKSILGGGVAVDTPNFIVLSSVPETSPQQRWAARIRSLAKDATGTVTVHAICAIVQ